MHYGQYKQVALSKIVDKEKDNITIEIKNTGKNTNNQDT